MLDLVCRFIINNWTGHLGKKFCTDGVYWLNEAFIMMIIMIMMMTTMMMMIIIIAKRVGLQQKGF